MAVGGGIAFIFLEVLISLGCCLGNILVIWAVWKSGALKQPTFCLIVSLAMTDFLVGSVAVPLVVVEDMKVKTSFHICLFISCVLIVPVQASVFTLLAIAVDRYLRVCIPFRYKSTVTKRRSWVLVAVCWMLACVLGFLPMFGWNNYDASTHLNSTSIDCQFIAVIPNSYLTYCNFCGSFILPLAIMISLYCYIFFKIRLPRENTGIAESGAYNHKEHKLFVSLVLVLVLFIACCLPLHIMNTIHYYNQNIQIAPIAIYFGILLSHANSMVNPVVYAFRIPKIKAEFRRIWRRMIGPQKHEDKNSKTPEIQTNTKDDSKGGVTVKMNQVEFSVVNSTDCFDFRSEEQL